MLTLSDINIIECDDGAIPEELACALQRAINSGTAWSFQGSYGRSMMQAIDAGECMLGLHSARDYWGNYIPARSQVLEGTKGSREYVVGHRGEERAAMLESLEG